MENSENKIFTNTFGMVTDKRIILNYKSGAEDIPVEQISSISFQYKRNYFFAIGGFAIGIVALIFMLTNLSHLGGFEVLIIIIITILGLLSGLANWIGHHNIVISTSGKNRKPLKVEMAKTRDGRQFVDAVKKVLFK
jgi:hypothetical protein